MTAFLDIIWIFGLLLLWLHHWCSHIFWPSVHFHQIPSFHFHKLWTNLRLSSGIRIQIERQSGYPYEPNILFSTYNSVLFPIFSEGNWRFLLFHSRMCLCFSIRYRWYMLSKPFPDPDCSRHLQPFEFFPLPFQGWKAEADVFVPLLCY